MFYKNFWVFFSLIPILLGILGILTSYSNKTNYDEGIDVYASVIEQPSNCDDIDYKSTFVKLRYDNKVYIEKIDKSYCEHIGKTRLLMRLSKDRDELFFIGQSFDDNIGASFFILVIGIFCAIKGFRKK